MSSAVRRMIAGEKRAESEVSGEDNERAQFGRNLEMKSRSQKSLDDMQVNDLEFASVKLSQALKCAVYSQRLGATL